jgi:hypothetical protein
MYLGDIEKQFIIDRMPTPSMFRSRIAGVFMRLDACSRSSSSTDRLSILRPLSR